MKISEVTAFLESWAPPALQESYDNAGLITGHGEMDCTGILCCLDATPAVIMEAVEKKCNLVVAHHPIVFSGLKKINGKNYIEQSVIAAIRNGIAIYAIHTNLDNVSNGVNAAIGKALGLNGIQVLQTKENTLRKLFTFVPEAQAGQVRQAIFDAGAGQIGNYSECSFNVAGTGTFKGGVGTQPFAGQPGLPHEEKEVKIEVIFPAYLENPVIRAMKSAHPYEEVAFDIIPLQNPHPEIGSGMIGELPQAEDENAFLDRLKRVFGLSVVRHTRFTGRQMKKVAFCGGAGSFLISKALAAGADAYVTADIKYHEFFDANDRLLLCDVGHFESEQFTIPLLAEVLQQKFPTFAVLKTAVKTNPVYYHL